MNARMLWIATTVFLVLAVTAQGAVRPSASADVERGRYLVAYGACNSCHTEGWQEKDGAVPVARWLTGNRIGFRGPWGTVYPANVRLRFSQMTEEQWLFAIRTRGGHPPMQWTNLRVLNTADQRAIYRFVRSLGPAGTAEPRDVPPGQSPTTPFYDVVPQTAASPGAEK
jgi:mono/diheme cytochrome c family protein